MYITVVLTISDFDVAVITEAEVEVCKVGMHWCRFVSTGQQPTLVMSITENI